MFYLTHVSYVKTVQPNPNSLIVIGSILSDFALTSLIKWDSLHKKKDIEAFSEFVKSTDPTFLPLLEGIKYHNTMDFLSHLDYNGTPGYTYKNATPELISLLRKAFSVDEMTALRKAHNFIESGVEMHIVKDDPELHFVLKQAIQQIDMQKLANVLAEFYEKDREEMYAGLENFFSITTKFELQEIDEWILLWNEIGLMQFNRKPDQEKVKEALLLSKEITKGSYREFLDKANVLKDMELVDSN